MIKTNLPVHLWPVWVKSVDPWTPFLFFTMKFGNTKTLISDLLITSVCHVGFDQALNRAVKTRDELHWMFHHYPPIHYDTMSQNRSPWVPQLRAGGCRCFLYRRPWKRCDFPAHPPGCLVRNKPSPRSRIRPRDVSADQLGLLPGHRTGHPHLDRGKCGVAGNCETAA